MRVPKVKTRPLIVPVKGRDGHDRPQEHAPGAHDEDDDEDDDEDEE